MLVIFSLKNVKQGHKLELTYLYPTQHNVPDQSSNPDGVERTNHERPPRLSKNTSPT